MSTILATEISTYEAKLPELLKEAGRYVVIKGTQVHVVLDTYSDALAYGYKQFGLEPFLVKQIAPTEQVLFFTRAFNQCLA